MYYERLFEKLKEKKVKYLLVGGMAMALYGAPRNTADVDLMLDLTKANLKKFVDAIKSLGYKPRAPISLENLLDPEIRKEWASEKNMVVLSLFNPDEPIEEVDIFITNPIEFKSAYKKRYLSASFDISMASLDDLIKLKEISGRKHDVADIPLLKKLKSEFEE